MSRRSVRARLPLRAWVDVVGVVLLLLLVAVTVNASRGDRSHFLTLLLACAGAVAVGRALGTFLPVTVRPRWAPAAVMVCALLFLTVLAATIGLGATYGEGDRAGGLEGSLRSVLTERRVALWHAALEILAEEPGGVGPGRFDNVPPRLLPEGARWADNDFLQQGAELGWAGLILTVLLFLWGFARLLVHPSPDAYVVLGAAALAALGIRASVDHLLHVPAAPIAVAALVGAAQASRRGAPMMSAASSSAGGSPET